MDPDELLRAIRRHSDCEDRALVDLVGALDHWLSTGGFLPRAWGGDRPTRIEFDSLTGERDEPALEVQRPSERLES